MKKLITIKLLLILGVAAGLFLALRAPQVQNRWLRLYVGSRVAMITGERGGGSGFLLEAPSGRNVYITNAHVCATSRTNVIRVNGEPARILKRDRASDLCAIQATEGAPSFGLNLRETGASNGEIIYVVGHPRLDPTTVTSGEYVGVGEIGVAVGMAQDEETCKRNGLQAAETMFGYLCYSMHTAGITTVSILGGNSGSLVVDYRGRVLGVMFAADPSDNRGYMIRHDDLKTFVEGL